MRIFLDRADAVAQSTVPCGVLDQLRGNLDMVNHGVHVIQDINAGAQVPGLAPPLDRLAAAVGDAKEAVLGDRRCAPKDSVAKQP